MEVTINGKASVRSEVLRRLHEDLLGPGDEREVLLERPSDRYLTGILYPVREPTAPEENDQNTGEGGRGGPDGETAFEGVALHRSNRPSSMGLSFRVRGEDPEIVITVTGGIYESTGSRRTRDVRWGRSSVEGSVTLRLAEIPAFSPDIALDGLDEFSCTCRALNRDGDIYDVTVIVKNDTVLASGRSNQDEHSLFQSQIVVTPTDETEFLPRPITIPTPDEDAKSAALLFRSAVQFATGHTASARWTVEDRRCTTVTTDWIPISPVPSVSANGSLVPDAAPRDFRDALVARSLAEQPLKKLLPALYGLVESYEKWIGGQRDSLNALPPSSDVDYQETGKRNLGQCVLAAKRMREGIDLIGVDENARRAFKLANRAMAMQFEVSSPEGDELRWRPFQLAYQLLNLSGLANPDHQDRELMDLLWFPTGGGKTEAYLGLIAFTLFHRRLREQDPEMGAGVGVLMRYTLRVLTNQQFERAAALIMACEKIRRGEEGLGVTPFSIGLWVGDTATPNRLEDARKDPGRVRVLSTCPACGGRLKEPTAGMLQPLCRSSACEFSSKPAPVFVVDDDIYENRPSLLIGTIDKFAQITRRTETAHLFGLDGKNQPPELVLQDELHLVSGPLGTITALYEIAIDALCTVGGVRPKIIGSTATIRRAELQVRALFNRPVFQFPPPALDQSDSGFATVDSELPGRLYCGITSAGRSPKFALQAVAASLMQSPDALSDSHDPEDIDPYWTLVGYFNSLRELGGAVVLFEDDVRRTVAAIAERREEPGREMQTPEEITSRISGSEIRPLLDRLSSEYPDAEIDSVLASNMISVGVDVPRLGLMLVNGQPKTVAEYIQATSRVGRGSTPGLIVVVYNAQRPRDLSRYESFSTWHRALYRDVEATSVTPFASRARDRALHATLTALLRLRFPGPSDSPGLTDARQKDIDDAVGVILDRVRDIDPNEREDTERQLNRLLDDWKGRVGLVEWWWSSWRRQPALMIGAEDSATLEAADSVAGSDAWATPNSMREVEPSAEFRIVAALKKDI